MSGIARRRATLAFGLLLLALTVVGFWVVRSTTKPAIEQPLVVEPNASDTPAPRLLESLTAPEENIRRNTSQPESTSAARDGGRSGARPGRQMPGGASQIASNVASSSNASHWKSRNGLATLEIDR